MKTKSLQILVILLLPLICTAQQDSNNIRSILRCLDAIDKKIEMYNKRISGRSIKTFTKLSRWEKKVQAVLEKVSPSTANDLFGPGKLSFSTALEKLRQGQQIISGYRARYDEYRDKLNTSLKYLLGREDKFTSIEKQVSSSIRKMQELEAEVESSEAIEMFIRERKQQLLQAAQKYLGKNRYLSKISKEAFYYAETVRNYRDIFSDPGRMENTAMGFLQKIPGFNDFIEKNSGITGLLGNIFNAVSGNNLTTSRYASLGYQSNAAIIQDLQQSRLSTQSIQQLIQNNAVANDPMQLVQNYMSPSSGSAEMPDFKPNDMRSKTFLQRIEFGTNFQLGKANQYLPGSANIGVQLAYKLNPRSSAGLGAGCRIGLGSGIRDISFSFGGVNLRSFVDWKLKGNFYVNGGFEYNYFNLVRNPFHRVSTTHERWKPAALVGINKKYTVGKVKGNMMLLYDLMARQRMPKTERLVFRFGYSF